MRLRFAGAMAAVFAALAVIGTSGAATASAPTAAGGAAPRAIPAAVSPDFTCPSATVCAFPNEDFTGNYPDWDGPATFFTNTFNGQWLSFSVHGAGNPNPGSVNDNSNSIMWVYNKDAGPGSNNPFCVTPGKWALYHYYGWFYIEYGVTSCGNYPTPLP